MALEIGSFITFTYPAVHQQGTRAHDRFPNVLVLHPNWQGSLHGLNFNYMTDEEIHVIRMIIDPNYMDNYKESLQKTNPERVRELENILRTAENAHVTSPQDFYNRVIKPFIRPRGWDPYRRYRVEKMTNTRVIHNQREMTGQTPGAPGYKPGVFQRFAQRFRFMGGPRLPTFKRYLK